MNERLLRQALARGVRCGATPARGPARVQPGPHGGPWEPLGASQGLAGVLACAHLGIARGVVSDAAAVVRCEEDEILNLVLGWEGVGLRYDETKLGRKLWEEIRPDTARIGTYDGQRFLLLDGGEHPCQRFWCLGATARILVPWLSTVKRGCRPCLEALGVEVE